MKIGILLVVILMTGCFSSSINEKEAKKLAKELFEHPEIKELDDCTTFHKYINGIKIRVDSDKVKKNNGELRKKTRHYKEVLVQEGIAEKDFEKFKRKLERTGLRHYYRKANYSVFVTGGLLGDIEGILVVHKNDTIPSNGFRLNEHYYIWIGNEIEKDVYWISGA